MEAQYKNDVNYNISNMKCIGENKNVELLYVIDVVFISLKQAVKTIRCQK